MPEHNPIPEQIPDHDLLGYLLGLLEPEEHAHVERMIQISTTVRIRVETLRTCVEPVKCDCGHCDPPQGLAVRVCETLRQMHVEITTKSKPAEG